MQKGIIFLITNLFILWIYIIPLFGQDSVPSQCNDDEGCPTSTYGQECPPDDNPCQTNPNAPGCGGEDPSGGENPNGEDPNAPPCEGCTEIDIPIVVARDPNDITGPPGFGPPRWLAASDRVPYRIRFENDPELATAPAQEVNIILPLDSSLNPLSFRLSDFGFGNFVYEMPENTSFFSERLDLRDSLGLFVDVSAGIDVTTREAFWRFESIDPATGLAVTNVLEGFLPVNDTSLNNGEGFVFFSVIPVNTSQTGDSVRAQADIIFDAQEIVATNIEKHVLDAGAPVSGVDPLPLFTDSTVVALTSTASDDVNGVGVSHVDIYVSEDGGPFDLYLEDVTDTVAYYEGFPGSTYSFYTLAEDFVGNREAVKSIGEATTTLRSNVGAKIMAKVYLEGFYDPDGDSMHTETSRAAFFPLDQPFNGMTEFTYAGTESVSTVPDSVADWVYLEVRDTADVNTVVAQRACFLKSDGRLMDVSGNQAVCFEGLPEGEYYLAIYHKSHLAVVSAVPLSFVSEPTLYDFTTSASQARGTEQQKQLGSAFTMYAGDYDGNGIINNLDFNAWRVNSAAVEQYLPIDGDGNGVVNNLDFNLWTRTKSKVGDLSIQK